MKHAIAWLLLPLAIAAHADVMKPKGGKAMLKVEYVFASAGARVSPSKDNKRNWNARRVVTLTATYVAEAPMPFGALHDKDPQQQQDIQALQAKANTTAAKMQPTATDMMKIAEECNMDEACITQRVYAYGTSMGSPEQVSANVKQQQAAINDMANPGTRFQLWRSTSQSGSYQVSEHSELQVYEMTCTDTKVCKRTVDTQGGGPIPGVADGRSAAGASLFEVDSLKKDLVLMLPLPVTPLPVETRVITTIPDDDTRGGKSFAKPILTNAKQITVPLKGDTLQSSGTQSYKIDGEGIEGGTLTVTWSLTPQ